MTHPAIVSFTRLHFLSEATKIHTFSLGREHSRGCRTLITILFGQWCQFLGHPVGPSNKTEHFDKATTALEPAACKVDESIAEI